MKNIIFHLGLGTLFTHELDAVLNHEWRVLPLISGLSDAAGMLIFVLAHIPLFSIMIVLVSSANEKVRFCTRYISAM
ncbi:MAG: DUF6713 family protein [bacterium]